jgi:exosortase A-associated hydrolase 2
LKSLPITLAQMVVHVKIGGMMAATSFFLPGAAGNLFAVYYPPAESAAAGEDVLYVHPFAAEMFASRSVIAALCRELARGGIGALTIDLYGCGDSSGDFGEARWEIWRQDLRVALYWLRERGGERISLWGLRLGALLALDFAAQTSEDCERILLWQPVLRGETALTQFFHMNADETYSGDTAAQLTDPEQRKSLPSGRRIEVAGYELASELVRSIDRVQLGPLGSHVRAPIHWLEVGSTGDSAMQADSFDVVRQWQQSGIAVSSYTASGVPFWLSANSIDTGRLAPELRRMLGDAGNK